MAHIYISYSSRDERAAAALKNWLQEHQYEVFLGKRSKKQERGDFENDRADFEHAIEEAGVVVFLVTPFWQAGAICQFELAAAKAAGKPMIAVLEAPGSYDLHPAIYIADLTRDRQGALDLLRKKLLELLALPPSGQAKGEGAKKPGPESAKDISAALQGGTIAGHDMAAGNNATMTDAARAGRGGLQGGKKGKNRHSAVDRTLKSLKRNIRRDALPNWMVKIAKLPKAGRKAVSGLIVAVSPKKNQTGFPRPGTGVKSLTAWIAADRKRVIAASFLLFIFLTALIGSLSERRFGGKQALRQELGNVKKRQSLFLSKIAEHLLSGRDNETALLLALEAMNEAQGQEDLFKARNILYAAWIKMQGEKLVYRGHDNHVSGVAFSPDGRLVLSASWDRTAQIWSLAGKKRLLTLKGHGGLVNSAVFSPDQKLVLTAALDNRARLFNARTGRLVRELKGHSNDLANAGFSRDGKLVVTASGDQTARIWNVASGQLLKVLLGHRAGLEFADFSPDAHRVVTASDDGKARILDVKSGRILTVMKGHGDGLRSARYDKKGNWIVTASQDRTARLWDGKSGLLNKVLKGHEWAVLSADFSPDSRKIVTASKDKTARVWDVKSGKQLLVLRAHEGIVSQAAFSPDGRLVATSSGDGTVRLWPLMKTDAELLDKARNSVTKCLTTDQRKKYFLDENVPEWCERK